MKGTLHFEQRRDEAHWMRATGGPMGTRLMLVFTFLCLLPVLFWTLMDMGIYSWDDFWHATAIERAGGEAGRLPEWRPVELLFPVLYLLAALFCVWECRSASRCRALILSADTLTHTYRLPFGLNRVIRTNWRISLGDIASAEVVVAPLTSWQAPPTALLRLTLRDGTRRAIDVVDWLLPGVGAHPRPLPVGDDATLGGADPLGDIGTRWVRPENRKILAEAVLRLPLLQALQQRGVAVSGTMSDPRDNDLFARWSVKWAICAALALIMVGFVLELSGQHQNLLNGLPRWTFWAVGALVLSGYSIASRLEKRRAPLNHHLAAVLLLFWGVSFATPPAVLLLNGLGSAAHNPQEYVVRAGTLVATDADAVIRTIALRGRHSRIERLKDGTVIQLKVRRGRLGLWAYDDTPLRDAADAQGIR